MLEVTTESSRSGARSNLRDVAQDGAQPDSVADGRNSPLGEAVSERVRAGSDRAALATSVVMGSTLRPFTAIFNRSRLSFEELGRGVAQQSSDGFK